MLKRVIKYGRDAIRLSGTKITHIFYDEYDTSTMELSMKQLTGIYIRALRDGKWESLDVASLTEIEMRDAFALVPKERVIVFLAALAKHIRETTWDPR
jgi:hypothetical protein